MRVLAVILLVASTAHAGDIARSLNPRARIDHYIGRDTKGEGYMLDEIRTQTGIVIRISGWDAQRLGKPEPTEKDLASEAEAVAWLAGQKTDADKDREKVDSTDKLQAEVIALRKELEALKKEKQR